MDPLTAFVLSIVGAAVFSDAKRHRGEDFQRTFWRGHGDTGPSVGWVPMHGRHVTWWVEPGEAVWIDAKYLRPISGNIFQGDKLAQVARAVKDASREAPVEFYAPYGQIRLIDEELVRESQEYAAYDPGEPFTDADIGQWTASVRDGNHRAFGSILGGERRVAIRVYDNDVQDVREGLRTGELRDETRRLLGKMIEDTGQEPEWLSRIRMIEAQYQYMVVGSAGPFIMVRTPWPLPRWSNVLKALTSVMREHGYRQKDISFIEGVTAEPSKRRDDDKVYAAKLDIAFAGGTDAAWKFYLYDWVNGSFILVRRPVEE